MRVIGFKAMDYNIGYSDGVCGRAYNQGSNSDLYDRGYLAGKRQRDIERIMYAVMGVAILGLVVVQAIGVIPR